MINSFFISYSLPAPYRRPLMLPPSRWRLFFKLPSFGHCYGVFLRAGFYVLLGSYTSARLGGGFKARRAHPPRTALCRSDLARLARCRRPSAFFRRCAGGRAFASSRPSAFVALRRAGGRLGGLRCSVCPPSAFPRAPHPVQEYSVLFGVCRSACSVRRAPFGI